MRVWLATVILALLAMGCRDGVQPAASVDFATVTVVPATDTATAAAATPSATAVGVLPSPAPQPSPVNESSVSLAVGGDVMLARSIGARLLESGPELVFAGVEPLLSEADLAVVNLETSISDRGTARAKSYTFRAPPEAAKALAAAGIDLVSLANNHALDFGSDALADSIALTEAEGIVVVGAGADAGEAYAHRVVERNGLRIAFLAYVDTPAEGAGYSRATWEAGAGTPGVAWASVEEIRRAVAAATLEADVVVVMLHAGTEYSPVPNDLQRIYARAAIDAGAALVLGHHPHVLQEVEEYNGGVIAYSLGNFVFDGFEGDADRSAIFRATLTRQGVAAWELVPVDVIDGLPVLAE